MFYDAQPSHGKTYENKEMIEPSGTIAITENGEGIDVSQYAYADVSV